MTKIELENFIKVVWAAGFRSGYANGEANQCAYEHGSCSDSPSTSEEAWKEDQEWITLADLLDVKFWGDQ